VSLRTQSPSQSKNEAVFATCVRDTFSKLDIPRTVTVSFDLLLGCDGVTSNVRDELLRADQTGEMIVRNSPLPLACFVFEVPHVCAQALGISTHQEHLHLKRNCRLEIRWGETSYIGVLYVPESLALQRREGSVHGRVEYVLSTVFPKVYSAIVMALGGEVNLRNRNPHASFGMILHKIRVHEVHAMSSVISSHSAVGPVVLLGAAF
jgi:2-polyprenyl-6-methoxyphenol hydroxylase-like FAD-dependent oxidoreductase